MTTQHHSWGDPVRFERKTERECNNCGMIKVTRHEQEVWTEFWRDGVQIRQFGERTPVCEPVKQENAA